MRTFFGFGKKAEPESEAARKLRETIARVDDVLAHADDPDFMERVREVLPDMHEATAVTTDEVHRRLREKLHEGCEKRGGICDCAGRPCALEPRPSVDDFFETLGGIPPRQS